MSKASFFRGCVSFHDGYTGYTVNYVTARGQSKAALGLIVHWLRKCGTAVDVRKLLCLCIDRGYLLLPSDEGNTLLQGEIPAAADVWEEVDATVMIAIVRGDAADPIEGSCPLALIGHESKGTRVVYTPVLGTGSTRYYAGAFPAANDVDPDGVLNAAGRELHAALLGASKAKAKARPKEELYTRMGAGVPGSPGKKRRRRMSSDAAA